MISIIIVGYNSEKDLDECLSSVFASSYKNFRVIFVDNNSADNSITLIKNRFPKVEIIVNTENSGFAGGNNIGIKKAISDKSEYIMLLNPDTIIDRDCLKNLTDKASKDTILQPLILLTLDGKNTNLINTTGGHLNFLGFSYCSDYKKERRTAKEKDIAIASGAAVLMPTNILEEIGMFDESFFMYHEDVDLFWRARLAGFNIRLIPDSVVWHKYSFSKNKKKMFYADRNRLIFLHKNFSLKYRMLVSPAFLINEILMFLYSLLSGWPKEKVSAWGSAIKNICIGNYKKKTSREQLVEEKTLKVFISPKIEFGEFPNPLFKIYNIFLIAWWHLIFVFV